MQTTKVRVVRAFYFDRKPVPVGTIIDLPSIFAREVISANKAELVEAGQERQEHSVSKEKERVEDPKARSQKALV